MLTFLVYDAKITGIYHMI